MTRFLCCTLSFVRTKSERVKQRVFDLVELRRGDFGDATAKFMFGERLELIAVHNAIGWHAVGAAQADFRIQVPDGRGD